MNNDYFKLVFIYKTVYGNNTAGYGIYLINNSDFEFDVKYDTGGFTVFDDEIVKLEGKKKDLGILLPHSRVLVEEQDLGALDFSGFVDLTLIGKKKLNIHFDIGKGSPESEKISIDGFKEKGLFMDFEINELI